MTDLDPLLWPESIALVGASPDKSIIRGRITEGVRQSDFKGPVYPVSRSHDEIAGMQAYPAVAELPDAVDLAIITVPAPVVVEVLEACGEKGIRAAVIISSGFAEERTAEGPARQRALTEIAKKYDMAVSGPNGEGFLNSQIPLTATFSPAVFDIDGGIIPQGSRCGGIAVVTQSGGVGFAFFNRGRPKELRFSYVVSTGNEAGIDCLDVMDYLIDDPHTEVLLVFMEGLRAPQRFAAVAAKAVSAKKPLLIAKMGRSEAAAHAVTSHTASLAGTYRAYTAMFDRYGVYRGENTEEMIDVAAGFAYFRERLPNGKRAGVLTPSGGAGVWLADTCEAHGLTVPPLDADTRAAIDELLPAYGASRNPVDVTAQVIFQHGFSAVLKLIAASPEIDAVVVACSLIHTETIENDIDNLRELGATLTKPVIFCGYTRAHPTAVALLANAGFPCVTSMPNAARAVAAMADYRAFLEHTADTHDDNRAASPPAPLLEARNRVYCEYETKALLAEWGIPVAKFAIARSADEAAVHASDLDASVALKVQSPDISHKTELGGVALGLQTPEAVREAFETIMASTQSQAPDTDVHGVLVEPMAEPGLEMIVGINRDPDFGPMLLVGSGGVLVEILEDVALSPVPLTRNDASRLLQRLHGFKLLAGVRGKPPADHEALVELMVAVSGVAAANPDTLDQLDLNPVIVHAHGEGVTVADALLVTRAPTHSSA